MAAGILVLCGWNCLILVSKFSICKIVTAIVEKEEKNLTTGFQDILTGLEDEQQVWQVKVFSHSYEHAQT